MVASLRKVRERTDLPASVARLEVRHGAVVSILQAERTCAEGTIEPGGVYLHDPVGFTPKLLVEVPGQIHRACPASDLRRFAVLSIEEESHRVVVVDHDGNVLASKQIHAWDCTWFRGHVALALESGPASQGAPLSWSGEVEPMFFEGAEIAQIWSADLEHKHGAFRAELAGHHIDASNDAIAITSAIDFYLWQPGSNAPPFSLMRSKHKTSCEVAHGVLSRDGTRAAVENDCGGRHDPQLILLRTNDLDGQRVGPRDGTHRSPEELAYSPSGEHLAALFRVPGVPFRDADSELPPVARVYRSEDGSVVGEIPNPNARTIAWLDDETLLLGGRTLSAWTW
ncbi:MAG: hypothetical protein AAGE52_41020 [Myxococcota bacterium]